MEALANTIVITHQPPPLPDHMIRFLYALTVRDLVHMNPPTAEALLNNLTVMSGGYTRRSDETESEFRARMISAGIIARRRFKQSQVDNGNIEELFEYRTLSNIASAELRRALLIAE